MQVGHDHIGYLGVERLLDLPKDWFYWAHMSTDIKNHIMNFERCLHFKAKPQRAELHPIMAPHPKHLVDIDYLTVESGKTDKDINILVVTDHFTRYSQSIHYPHPNSQSWCLNSVGLLFCPLQATQKILSDQGCNFESSLISELCAMSKSKKHQTSP